MKKVFNTEILLAVSRATIIVLRNFYVALPVFDIFTFKREPLVKTLPFSVFTRNFFIHGNIKKLSYRCCLRSQDLQLLSCIIFT